MSNTIANPIDGLFDQCKTSKGIIKEDLIRCALASAYRAGYASCLGKLPKNIDGCAVRAPHWPIDEDRVTEMEEKIRSEMRKST